MSRYVALGGLPWVFRLDRGDAPVRSILTVTLRFSPRLGFFPVMRALANSNAATAALAGPSHNSAVIGRTRSRQTFGSSGLCHQALSVLFQISAALARSCRTSARAVMER